MGVQCLVPDCGHCSDREKCRYYRVPMDLLEYSKWKDFLNLTDALIQSKKNPRVCSCHFKGEKRPLNLNLSNLQPTKKRQTLSCATTTITDEYITDDIQYDDTDCLNQQKQEINNSRSPRCDDDNLEELLSPVISLRVKKVDEATQQQKEMHLLALQREQLQIKALQDHVSQQGELHTLKMEQEKEFHQLRMSQEKDLHLQKIRCEQELHQLRLLDYNKLQSSSYSVMYKQ